MYVVIVKVSVNAHGIVIGKVSVSVQVIRLSRFL